MSQTERQTLPTVNTFINVDKQLCKPRDLVLVRISGCFFCWTGEMVSVTGLISVEQTRPSMKRLQVSALLYLGNKV